MYKNKLPLFELHVFLLLIFSKRIYAEDFASITNCAGDVNSSFWPYEVVIIAPEWKTGEKHLVHNYIWTYEIHDNQQVKIDQKNWLHPISNGTHKLIVPSFGLLPGEYIIKVLSKKKSNVKDGPSNALENGFKECKIVIMSLAFVVIISGGSKRTVPPRTRLIFNGESSFDPNRNTQENEDFLYYWTCKQKKQPPSFCNKEPISTKPQFSIPSKLVEEDDQFNVSLVIKPFYYKYYSTAVTQTVDVVSKAALLKLQCRKNCIPIVVMPNFRERTLFEVTCAENCAGIKDTDYKWTVERIKGGSDFDYTKTRYGRESSKFSVEKNAFTPGTYKVEVELNNRRGYGSTLILFHEPPSVSKCELHPKKGKSLTTDFKISCEQIPTHSANLYEIYVINDDGRQQLLTERFYPQVLEATFKLPESIGKKFVLRVQRNGPYKELDLDVEVTSTFTNMSSTEMASFLDELYNGGTSGESIAKKLTSGNINDKKIGMSLFQNMVAELENQNIQDEKLRDFIEDLKYSATETLIKTQLESLGDVYRMTEALTKLQSYNEETKADPYLAKLTTTFCKKAVDKSLELAKDKMHLSSTTEKTQKILNVTVKCFEANSNANYDIMKPIELNITTETPVYDMPVLTENYANYVDHEQDYYKNLDFLRESSFNVINGSSSMAKLISLTSSPGEEVVVQGNFSETTIFKDSGKAISRRPVSGNGVTVIASKDFADDVDDIYELTLTVWNKDVLWWNPAFTKVATNIIRIEFGQTTHNKKIDAFEKPVNIFLNVKNDTDFLVKTYRHLFIVPKNYYTLYDNELNYHIKVFRVYLPAMRMLLVKFYDLTLDDVFDVVLTENKFPTTEDFKQGVTTVSLRNNQSLRLFNEYDNDIFIYVGMLLNKHKTFVNRNISFEISTVVTHCVRWVVLESKWEPACKPGNLSNETVIHCKCYHLSVIAGYLENLEPVVQQVFAPELELLLNTCKTIFFALVATLAVYFLLLMVLVQKKQNQVYYLGDNHAIHRFAYLVTIKTGMKYHAGTSSTVTIRITGEKYSSEPHALNYPDPKLNLLQQMGQDVFVLTTKHHLGNLEKIELWFDSTGPNPSWYCRNVTVYDMQNGTEWYFDVKKRLSLTRGDVYLAVELTKETTKEKKLKKCKFRIVCSYHTWYFWQYEENFSYAKKLTVLLSTILTTSAIALTLQGVPLLVLKDSLDEYHYFWLNGYDVFVAFASSFPTFVLHISIAWCFRCSNLQISKEGTKLPFLCTLSCWVILIILIVTSTTILTIFGFWVPLNESLIWLTICAIAVAFTIVIYENVFICIQHCFCRLELPNDIRKKFRAIQNSIEVQRKYLHKQFGEALLRPYLDHLYTPLKEIRMKEKIQILNHRHYIITELEDLMMFGVYIIILYLVVLANRDSLVTRGKTEMEEILKGTFTRTFGFNKIESTETLYRYLGETLIPSIHPLQWYGYYWVTGPGLMKDFVNKYVGVVRLRQHRSKENLCQAPELMSFLNLSCHPEFSNINAETKTFGENWGKFDIYAQYDRLKDIWKYSPQEKTETIGYVGEISTYSGGGYVGYLGRTIYNSYSNLRRFFMKMWIDENSRVVFIEFLAYNANYNLFTAVRLIFEGSSTGFMYKTIHIEAVRMLFVENEVELSSFVLFSLFVFWVATLTCKQSIGILKKIRTFYKDLWIIIDSVILLMSVICIVLFVVRIKLIGNYLSKMENTKHNEFISYFYIFYIQDFLTVVAAVLVCIATVRLWKFLRFGKMFRTMERTLSIASLPLFCFFIAFFVLLLASSLTVMLVIGNENERTYSSIKTIIILMTAAMDPKEIELGDFIQNNTAVFYVIVYTLALIACVTIFVAIVIRAHFQAQMEFSSETDNYTIKHYLQERAKYLPKFLRYKFFRLKSGQTEVYVFPKEDRFLYFDSVSLPTYRMKIMKYMTQSIIRNQIRKKSHFSDYDRKLMLNIFRVFLLESKSSELEIFYKGLVEGKKVKFIDERNLEKIANLTNELLKKQQSLFVEEERDPVYGECLKAIRKKQRTLKKCFLDLKILSCKMDSVELKFESIKNMVKKKNL